MSEIFRDIPGYEGLYQVSNLGNIKSLAREKLNKGKYLFNSKEKILKQSTNKYGYRILGLRKRNSNSKTFLVHQLVAITFLNHKPNGFKIVVDHINNVKIDNRVENLQLISNRENSSKDQKNRSSVYVGVVWYMSTNKWKASIEINGSKVHLGYFESELEASEAYQNALKAIENNEEIIVKRRIFTSEYKGVSWCKSTNKWVAAIKINGKTKNLGRFNSEIEASIVYQNKLKEI